MQSERIKEKRSVSLDSSKLIYVEPLDEARFPLEQKIDDGVISLYIKEDLLQTVFQILQTL